jgi:N-acetylglutamate synthase-like GNAT family acetyltransferase
MKIRGANLDDAEIIASIVSDANKGVADQFDITIENNPKHPSFYTRAWALSDLNRGEEYFICCANNISYGCVAFEQPDPDTAYLNRLSVLPQHRHHGIGTTLVNHILEYSRSKDIKYVSIGIIAAHEVLKKWYSNLGFIEGETQKIDHLPFDVTYMRHKL